MRYLFGVTSILLVLSAGCSTRSGGPTATTTSEGQKSQAPAGSEAAQEGVALVRFINADASGKPRELWVDDRRLFSDVSYKSTTSYAEVPGRAVKLRVRETNGPDDLAVNREEVVAGRHYTVVAVPRKDGTSVLLDVRDDLAAPKPGQAKVRIVNATSGVDDMDLFRAGTQDKIQKGVDAADRSNFKEVDPGTFEIRPNRRPFPAKLTNLVVEPDRFYTFVVIGKPDALDVVRVEDQLQVQAAR